MELSQDISLKDYSTMHLGGNADYFIIASSAEHLIEIVNWAQQNHIQTLMVGEGSNILWRDEGFRGLVIQNKIKGLQIEDQADYAILKSGSGEIWDDVVEKSTELNLSGIECLSLIPGTSGATPVQNVGAYGQDIGSVLYELDAYDLKNKKVVTLSPEDCQFGYRQSIFKTEPNRFYIMSISLKLSKQQLHPPFYKTLSDYLETEAVNDYSPQSLRDAVIAIRTKKLPNPKDYYNLGSFFGNPIINNDQVNKIRNNTKINPPVWKIDNQKSKISAAWLIEQAGFKNYHDQNTGMATWKNQPLVLVNELARSTQDVLTFKEQICQKVFDMFEVQLQMEPQLLP